MTPYDTTAVTTTTKHNHISSIDLKANSNSVTLSGRSLKLLYSAVDENGSYRTVPPLSVFATFAVDGEESTSTLVSLPDLENYGIGSKTVSIPKYFFTTLEDRVASITLTVTLDDGANTEVISNVLSVELSRIDDYSGIVSVGAGMILTLPQTTLYPKDVIVIPVTAHTGDQALTSWVLSVSFNQEILEVVSVKTSNLFIEAVVTKGPGIVSISTSGIATGVDDESVTGSDIGVVVLKFAVQRGFEATRSGKFYYDVLSMMVSDMVNTYSIKFASNAPAVVRDGRSGVHTSARVRIASDSVVGMFAFADQLELVNMFPFSNVGSRTQVLSVYVFTSRSGKLTLIDPEVDLLSCSVDGNSSRVVSVNSDCSVTMNNTMDSGGVVDVVVRYGDVCSERLTFTVWYPVSVVTSVEDYQLEEVIINGDSPPNASCVAYQSTKVTALANFSSSVDSRTVVVTPFAEIVTGDSTIVSIDSSDAAYGSVIARGAAVGSTEVSTKLYGNLYGIRNTPAAVSVTDEMPLHARKLSLISYSEVSGVVENIVSAHDVLSPAFSLDDKLRAEGKKGYITAIVEWFDGSTEDVTGSLNSLQVVNQNIALVETGDFAPYMEVVFGASSFSGVGFVASYSVCGNTMTADGEVNITLPRAVEVSAIPSSARITSIIDIASGAPFSVPTECILSPVTVKFADNTSLVKTFDPRTLYRLSSASDRISTLLYFVDNVVRVNTSSPDYFSAMHKSFSVDIIFNDEVSTTVWLELVTLSRLEVAAAAYPVSGSSDSTRKSVISVLDCSEEPSYQRLHAITTGYLTVHANGSEEAVDVSAYVTYAVLSGSESIGVSSNGIISGFAPGSGVIASILTLVHPEGTASMQSTPEFIDVLDNFVPIVSIVVFPDGFSYGPTFRGFAGDNMMLRIAVSFEDGTFFDDVVSGPSASWVPLSKILVLSSGVPSAIEVDSFTGECTLQGNAPSAVSLTATAICSESVFGSLDVFANLDPSSYDVDLGSLQFAPFGVLGYDELFYVPVRINAGALDVTSFQIVIEFDPRLVLVTSDSECWVGANWKSAWDCTTNDPIDRVLIAGACGLLPSKKCKSKGIIEVAKIRFRTIGFGTSVIKARIIKVEDSSRGIADADAVSGNAEVIISQDITRNRRRMEEGESTAEFAPISFDLERHWQILNSLASDSGGNSTITSSTTSADFGTTKGSSLGDTVPTVSSAWRSRYRPTRRLQAACVPGDVNGDSSLDISDVVMLQYVISGLADLSTFTTCQMIAADPDRNGLIDGVDIQYLLRVVTKKYRLLKALYFDHSDNLFSLSAYVVDDEDYGVEFNHKTELRFEILGTNLVPEIGDDVAVTADGLLTMTGKYGDAAGLFFSVVSSNGVAQEFSVAMSITTFDSFGYSSPVRGFFLYCSPTLDSCGSVYGAGLSAFKPYGSVAMDEFFMAPPTPRPSAIPTIAPTPLPTFTPTRRPRITPTARPTAGPTFKPTREPTSSRPTRAPTDTNAPISKKPTAQPSEIPTSMPTGKILIFATSTYFRWFADICSVPHVVCSVLRGGDVQIFICNWYRGCSSIPKVALQR